ncbi:HRDC domain-containing protein [Actinomycetospora lutea]|uniref:HRDC domain-containing protein n=1 Tax=Actinomycetospora lutea TaxID=663604 RepID=UPI003B67E5C9
MTADTDPARRGQDDTPGDPADDPADDAAVVDLLEPAEGVPPLVADRAALSDAAAALDSGHGPVAVDAERASGYRYSARAYLVQLRREGAGTFLVDPIACGGDLGVLDEALRGVEWVLHAASQDLACLAEVGMRPDSLFDTELAGRLVGYPRVGLGPLTEHLLGVRLQKGHGAADWSRRPLPDDWLTYAALDVELLVPLREAVAADLERQGKTTWAQQEFEAVRLAPPPPPRAEPWRRTSGVHKIRRPAALAVVRELWGSRDELAATRDVAPGRLLPDAAIVDAALREPARRDDLVAMPVFRGRAQRRLADRWWSAIERARALPRTGWPASAPPPDGPPPAHRWGDKDPAAAARLAAARAALAGLSERTGTPVENLVTPDLVRRLCWAPPPDADADADGVAAALAELGARPWQAELAAPLLAEALRVPAPEADPDSGDHGGDPQDS